MKKLTGVKAISFDVDDTLFDFDKVMRQSLQYTLDELAVFNPSAAAALDIESMIAIRNRVSNELKEKRATIEQIRLESFRRTLQKVGRTDEALSLHLYRVYMEHRYGDIELFPDVLPALSALKEKYTLGVLSNGNSYPERCGLDGIFRFAVFSQEYGIEKPDPRLFQIALEKAGCVKEQLLHIGDSVDNDVIPSSNLGIKCAWLNRNKVENDSGVRVYYEINSLTDLMDMLQ